MPPSKRNELIDAAMRVFYRHGCHATGLDKVRPEADLMMTVSGEYGHLQEQIQVHRLRLASERGEAVAWETAVATDLPTAIQRAYAGTNIVQFDGVHYRTDIGQTETSALGVAAD